MLNFTGSTKKRVVNLGDSRRPQSRNYLEHARKERQQREQARLRERAATVIQHHVARYIALSHAAEALRSEWTQPATHGAAAWDRWCAQAAFVVRWGRRSELARALHQIEQGIAALDGCLSAHAVAGLLRTLRRVLPRSAAAVRCLQTLLAQYPNVEGNADGVVAQLAALLGSGASTDVVALVFQASRFDSARAFVRFLATVPTAYLARTPNYAAVVRQRLPHAGGEIALLLDAEKVALLVNALSVQPRNFSPEDYLVHATILLKINFAVKVHLDSDDEKLVQESRLADDDVRQVDVSPAAKHALEVLYSTSYIAHAVEQIRDGVADSHLAVQFVCLLMCMLPEHKTKLCMMLITTPQLPQWLFAQLSTHGTYQMFRKTEESEDTVGAPTMAEVAKLALADEFWDLLYTYEQVLSYWLIVSNDSESFHDSGFSLAQVTDFTRFLKCLCLTLICRSHDSLLLRNPKIARLKDVSIALLNQLYLKNLRLKYLASPIWKLKLLRFDINNMSLMIIEDEEQRQNQDDSSDESPQLFRAKKRSRGSDVAAKLEILSKVPFFVDFNDRVKVFQALIQYDQSKLDSRSELSFFNMLPESKKLTADIHRESLLLDAFDNFHKSGHTFKNKLLVTFYNEYGAEAGIDGGGLTKEFLTSVVMEGFSRKNALELFRETSQNELYPNDDIYLKILKRIDLPAQQLRLMYIKFLGMIIGKCLYESVLIDVSFAPFFLSKWKGDQNATKSSVNELGYLDTELYLNLMKLLEMKDDELKSLDLNFTLNEHVNGSTLVYDLLPPNGDQTSVTTLNRLNYIHQISNFKLNQSLHIQSKYFLEGLYELINDSWLDMFDPIELQMLISGGNDIDINDWKQHVQYGGYFDDDLTVKLFWEVVEEMTSQERCDLVKFVTSVSRAPLLGFGALSPNFGISNGGQSQRLPTASTCVNLLKLPDYKDKKTIREKLLYSISANSGFDLS